jgi:2-polyprenyl-3-methyl-5-hydroxy-6-metoxy-1,4-benzoquinol methylase
MTPAKARLKNILFFCRPSVPVHFNNDPVKYTVRSESSWTRFVVGCLPQPLNMPFMTLHVSERIVEIPFVFANLHAPKGSTVIDLGCTESSLSLELANRGYKVLASDLRPYPFTHPNLTHLTGDFASAQVAENSVDAVIAVSTLEHVGLNAYRNGCEMTTDHSVVRKVRAVLKPGGQFVVTVPFGIKGQTEWYRIYDRESLSALLVNFDLERVEYYCRKSISSWEETSEKCAAAVTSPTKTNCVALVSAAVRKDGRDLSSQFARES